MSTIVIYIYKSENDPMPEQPFNAALWKSKGFDFLCFVTRKEGIQDFDVAWYIDELPISWKDSRINAVLPKLNPQSVLEGYDYSVWIDPGTKIEDDSFYLSCKELHGRGTVYADKSFTDKKSPHSYIYRI